MGPVYNVTVSVRRFFMRRKRCDVIAYVSMRARYAPMGRSSALTL